jgi:hypothetical protein
VLRLVNRGAQRHQAWHPALVADVLLAERLEHECFFPHTDQSPNESLGLGFQSGRERSGIDGNLHSCSLFLQEHRYP